MTNPLLASVTGASDGVESVSSSDRNFYPEYGLTAFKANLVTYTPELQTFDTVSSLNNIFGQGIFGSSLNYTSSPFVQNMGTSIIGNYGRVPSYSSF